MPEKIRAFIAIELTSEIKASLACLEETLKKSNADVSWVKPQNLHLTLKFLGERGRKQIDSTAKILDDIAQEKSAFILEFSSVEAFPKTEYPRVVWVGLSKGEKETSEIANILEEEIAKLGIPKETRPFSCHISIGRVRSPKNRQNLVDMLKELGKKFPLGKLKFTTEKITLFKSTLSSTGPTYEPLHQAYLKKT